MDHDMYSCNLKPSFLDDLSDFSQDPSLYKYPLTGRIQPSYNNRDIYNTTQTASLNYYNADSQQQNYQRQNLYNNYNNYPNYDFNNTAIDNENRLAMQSIKSTAVSPNQYYDSNSYQNYTKYCTQIKPQQPLYLPSASAVPHSVAVEPQLCPTLPYQYSPQYYHSNSGGQSIYYEQQQQNSGGGGQFEERGKMDRLSLQNIANIDQNIYVCERKLQFFLSQSQTTTNLHELNEIKEKLAYFQQLKEKFTLSRGGGRNYNNNINNNNNISNINNKSELGDQQRVKNVNNYGFPGRNEPLLYNCQTAPLDQYYDKTFNSGGSQSDSQYNNFYQQQQQYSHNNNNNSKSITIDTNSKEINQIMYQVESTSFIQSDCMTQQQQQLQHKSFISELIEPDNNNQYNDQYETNVNSRDELSTPPIAAEFTDLTSTSATVKICPQFNNIIDKNEKQEEKHDFHQFDTTVNNNECYREEDKSISTEIELNIDNKIEQEMIICENEQSGALDINIESFDKETKPFAEKDPNIGTKIESEIPIEICDFKDSKKFKIQFSCINSSKWVFKRKRFYFHLKIKNMNFNFLKKKTCNSKLVLDVEKNEVNINNENCQEITGTKKVKNVSRRIKDAESFIKRKFSRGSYFNNSDNEDMNISKKSLRNSMKSEMKTRIKKGINFDENSMDDSTSSSDCDIDSTFELKFDNSCSKKMIHKILGSRIIKAIEAGESSSTSELDKDIEEYYLKYKGLSYIHCEWKAAEAIDDPTFPSKLKRYKNIKINSIEESEDCLFNPDYVEIERVLDLKEIKEDSAEQDDKEIVTYYLVKWRNLPYEEISWEKSEDVDPSKVKDYLQRNEDSYVENTEIIKPTHIDWTPIASTMVYKNGNILRDYQLEGVNWLTFCWITNRNCILADEMGLGKTIQSIAFLVELYNYKFKGPFLVIVPLSTLGNWQREFEQWSDLNVIVYHGSARGRNIEQNYETYSKNTDSGQPKQLLFNALITTYEVLISDLLFLSKFQWIAAIIDEAHRLKNKRCKLFEGLKILDLQFRVLLTGTPLQNNVQELYNLLNFLEPSKFYCESAFLAQYGDLRSEEQVASLKLLLKPMMLRRLKEDVEKGLAPKEEIVIEVELTNIQKKYYRAILERNFGFLSKGISGNNVPNLMNTMMELRKCCNHPFLIKGAEDSILNNIKNGSDMGNITKFIQNKIVDEETLQFYSMVYASGKLVLIHKLLSKLKQDGHKVLIFSQMVRVLDILEDYLIYERYQYERIDGRIYGMLRQEAIDRFSNDPEKFVFLLCTKAGGLGINLTAADVVIIYDSDWNPQNDLQAQARCHRIGQRKLVNVYRLITRNTYEREMFDRASLKLGLDKAILQSMSYTESKPTSQLSKKEIEDLLKLGAYGALLDDDKDGEKFCEEDIEKILLSRSTIVKLNNLERNSSFSKASFSISDNRVDICLDDPNFWQKWAKKAGVDEKEICNTLIMDKPRLRRQTNRYKPNCTLYDEISGDESNSSFIDSSKSRFTNTKILPNNISKLKKKSNKSCSGESIDENKEDICNEEVQYKATPDMDRYDLFKAEKCLLQFGWGRWEHAIEKITFKTPISLKELESLCRTILLYAHRYYNGDDRIHSFIEDLLLPDSDSIMMRKHVGYSAPVARGRRGRKGPEEAILSLKKEVNTIENKMLNKRTISGVEDLNNLDEEQSDILTNISTPLSENGDTSDNGSEFSVLICPNFRKHIQRTSHKLLHRIQFLYFLHHDIIGPDRAKLILNNSTYLEIPGFSELKLFVYLDNDCLPLWWNRTVDKSLLLGIFKHGWEKYDEIFKDPCLGFVDWLAGTSFPESDGFSKNHKLKSNKAKLKEKDKSLNSNDLEQSIDREKKEEFPTNTELNIRLRKIIGSFQKLWRQREHEKNKLRALGHSCDNIVQNVESSSGDTKTSKWSRREETEFYRAINSYGIEKHPDSEEFTWTNFRNVCNLPRKSNDSLTEYFKAFYTMCQKVCQKYPLTYGDNHSIEVDNISSERACRCLVKINLISKIRNEIIPFPQLEERISLCQITNDFPSWWIAGYHDLSLLKGIARYGANRTELSIISDSNLGFHKTISDLLLKQHTENNSESFEANVKIESLMTEEMLVKIEEISTETEEVQKISNETKSIINKVEQLEDDEDIIKFQFEDIKELVLEYIFGELIDEVLKDKGEKLPINKSKDEPMNSLEKNAPNSLFDASLLSKIGWPKERVLLSRLELIVQTVEKGMWPFSKTPNPSISKTISETLDQFTDSIKSCKEEVNVPSKAIDTIKTEPTDSSFKSKRRGRKRAAVHLMLSKQLDGLDRHEHFTGVNDGSIPEENNMRSAYESWSTALMSAALSSSLSSDPALFMQKMLQMSPEVGKSLPKSSSTSETLVNNTANGIDLSNGNIKPNSSVDSTLWPMQQSSSFKSSKQNVRRGRRPKHVRSFEMAKDSKPDSVSINNIINNYSTNPLLCGDNTNNNPEIIIPVINIYDGTIVYDETAPKRKNLEFYLTKNTNFMPYSVEEEDQKIFRKVAKSRGQDTSTLDSLIFTQYMSFLMNTMMASQGPFNNMYNNLPTSSEVSKTTPSSEEQLNAASLYMQYFSMMTAANQPTISSEYKPSIVNCDDNHSIKAIKRPHTPTNVSRQGTPAKVKSYSISHLTESSTTKSDENKIPAHSKTDHITLPRHNVESSLSSSLNSNFHNINTVNSDVTVSKPHLSDSSPFKSSSSSSQVSNHNQDFLGAYQAYLYSAMMYSDYVAYMQQYSLLNNTTKSSAPPPPSFDMFANNKSSTAPFPDTNATLSFLNDSLQPRMTSVLQPPPPPPLSIVDCSLSTTKKKKTKVTSFSVESMGIAVNTSSSCSTTTTPSTDTPSKSNVTSSSSSLLSSHLKSSSSPLTSAKVAEDCNNYDDFAVLDLSNNR